MLRPVLILVATYLLACIGCASCQRRLIYFPPKYTAAEMARLGPAENLRRWTNAAGTELGWMRSSPIQPATGQVLILHGNAGCAFYCSHYADVIQQAARLDVYMVEYPGYADRPGSPSEQTLEATAEEGLMALGISSPVYVVGESLGTGVAAWLAGRHPDRVAGVALLAPYNGLVDVAQSHMFLIPVSLLLRDRFPAQKSLETYHGPVAMAVGGRDTVVPAKFGRRLYEGYQGPKKLWEFPEGDHGTLMVQPPEFWKEIVGFWLSAR